ncbi:hypothetical protein D9M68_95260 [compost metagenome]
MEAIHKTVMHMDRNGHGSFSIFMKDHLSYRNFWTAVRKSETSRMGQRGKIHPRNCRKVDQIINFEASREKARRISDSFNFF